MTTYYVDMDATYESTCANNGTASGTPWGGASGLLRAVAAVAAGETIYVANAPTPADNETVDRLTEMFVTDSSDVSVGDELVGQDYGATFRVAVIVTNSYLLGETGVDDSWRDYEAFLINGGPESLNAVGNPSYPGIVISEDFAASGDTTSGAITLRGVASDWTTDEHAYLDCDSACDGITVGGVDGWHVRYVEIDTPKTYGIKGSSFPYYWRFEHVKVVNSGDTAWEDMYGWRTVVFDHIEASGSTQYGLYRSPTYGSVIRRSVFVGNGGHGFYGASYQSNLLESIFSDNGGDGIYCYGGDGHVNIGQCVCDGNSGDAIEYAAAPNVGSLNGCRLTNNGGYGVNAAGAPMVGSCDGNLYYNNTSGARNNFPSGEHDIDAAGDGYTDDTNGDFSLTSDAEGRRIQVDLDVPLGTETGTTFYATAGLTPTDSGGGDGGAALSRVRLGM